MSTVVARSSIPTTGTCSTTPVFPWRTTGKVRTEGQWGSGTTIGPRLCGGPQATSSIGPGGDEGGVSWVTFTSGPLRRKRTCGVRSPRRMSSTGSRPQALLSDEQTAFDYVVLVMSDRIGDVVGYPGYRTYDERWNGDSYWQYIGYPAELASGERPAFQGEGVVSSVGATTAASGQTGLRHGALQRVHPGQSGGITWGWWGDEPWPRVVGVGSTIGSTAVQTPSGTTTGDNEYGGGPALSTLIGWARANFA